MFSNKLKELGFLMINPSIRIINVKSLKIQAQSTNSIETTKPVKKTKKKEIPTSIEKVKEKTKIYANKEILKTKVVKEVKKTKPEIEIDKLFKDLNKINLNAIKSVNQKEKFSFSMSNN